MLFATVLNPDDYIKYELLNQWVMLLCFIAEKP